MKHVIETDRCVGCGACVLTCPFNCLEYIDERPKEVTECKICGICEQACPRRFWPRCEVEKSVFGRERYTEEKFGVYRKLVVVQARDERVLKVCQDGGGVTAILLYALEEGLIDGAIVAGTDPEKPFLPVPKFATTPEEILEGAGTKYSYSPNMLALAEVVKQKKSNVAFVGTPCQIHAVRKIQMVKLKKHAAPIKLAIGLMCSESFSYSGLMEEYIRAKSGVNLDSIEKMNIKGKMLVTTDSGVETISLSDIKQYARRSCSLCDDFSAEFADISAGGLGLEGHTFLILRTKEGEEIFSAAEKAGWLTTRPVKIDEFAMKLLHKLTRKKQKPAA